MKKQILSLFLACALCACATACGQKDGEGTTSQDNPATSYSNPISVDAEDVTPEGAEGLLDGQDIGDLPVIVTPEYPSFEPADLDKEEKLEDLTYMVSSKWTKNESTGDNGEKIVTYDTGDCELYVTATAIDEATEAIIQESAESNDWDGLLAIWTQDYTEPNTASWYDSLQVYIPGARTAWEINATADDVDIPADELKEAQDKTELYINPSTRQYRGLSIVGEKYIYTLSYGGLDLFILSLTTDWNNLIADCKVGDGGDAGSLYMDDTEPSEEVDAEASSTTSPAPEAEVTPAMTETIGLTPDAPPDTPETPEAPAEEAVPAQ